MIKCYFLWVTLFMTGRATSDPRWQIEPASEAGTKSQCKRNCNLLRNRMCGDQLCNHGTFTEHIFDCDYPNLCPQSEMQEVKVTKPCAGLCDRAIEQVELHCPTNPRCRVVRDRFCTDESGCLGQWGNWGQYGRCNRGFRQRKRGCFLADKTTKSIYCKNSLGEYTQTDTKFCSTSRNLNNLCLPGPTTTRNEQCRCHCKNIHDVLPKGILYGKCDEAKIKQGLLLNASCNTIKQFQVSCEGGLESRQCAAVDGSFLCNSYLDWGPWGEWVKRESTNQEYRQRHQWCSTNLFPIFDSLGCYRTVKIQEECQKFATTSPSRGAGVDTWVIIVIAILFGVLLVLIVVVCFQIRKRNTRRKAANSDVRANDIEMVEKYPNDVFLEDESSALQTTEGKEITNKEDQSQRLTVFQRFQKVSEHLYESISPSKSKSARQPSRDEELRKRDVAAEDCDKDIETQGNEYTLSIVTDSNENKLKKANVLQSTKSPTTKRMKKPTKTGSTKHPLRISVTITNPDGKQVGKDVYKSKLQPLPVVKNTQQREQTKKRWSRVPTPEAMKEKKFFETDNDTTSDIHRVHVQSVKYGTPDAFKEHKQSSKSPNNDRYGLRKFLQKLKKPAASNTSKSRWYDQVPKEDIPESSRKIITTGHPHQMPVSSRRRIEEEALWSESTFDDEELPPPLNSLNKPTSVGQGHQRDKKTQNSKKDLVIANMAKTNELPPPPPELLTPNTDVRSPMHHRWSDQSVHNVAGCSMSKSAAPTSSTNALKKSGYLDMSTTSEDKSRFEKRCVKLGLPLLPKKPSEKMKSVVLQSLDGSPQREVDLKYVAHAPLKSPDRSPCKGDLPIDRYGYLDLNYTKSQLHLAKNC